MNVVVTLVATVVVLAVAICGLLQLFSKERETKKRVEEKLEEVREALKNEREAEERVREVRKGGVNAALDVLTGSVPDGKTGA